MQTKSSLFFLMNLLTISSCNLEAYLYPYETPIVKYLTPIDISEYNSGIEFVDCIYMINLDERAEKWMKMKGILQKNKLKVNRVRGINGWKISDEAQKELAGPYPVQLCGGQLGCLLSHISAIKDAYERGFEVILMLEDDVEILEETKQISHILSDFSRVDPDWDILFTDTDQRAEYGGYYRPLTVDPRPDQQVYPLEYYFTRLWITNELMQTRYRWGLHSYLISRKGVKKVLDYFTHVYLWSPIDVDIHHIPGMRKYSSTKDILTNQRFAISDTNGRSSLNTALGEIND